MSFSQLPVDAVRCIITLAADSVESYNRVSRVCKLFRRLTQSEELWQKMFESRWPLSPPTSTKKGWFEAYKQRHTLNKRLSMQALAGLPLALIEMREGRNKKTYSWKIGERKAPTFQVSSANDVRGGYSIHYVNSGSGQFTLTPPNAIAVELSNYTEKASANWEDNVQEGILHSLLPLMRTFHFDHMQDHVALVMEGANEERLVWCLAREKIRFLE